MWAEKQPRLDLWVGQVLDFWLKLIIKNRLFDLLEELARSELKLRAEIELVDNDSLPNDGLVIEDTRTYE